MDHMIENSKLFSSYSLCARNQKIKIINGSFSTIARKGLIAIQNSLFFTMSFMFQIFLTILSVTKLTRDLKCCTKFPSTHCEFQDVDLERKIGNAKENNGLYYFEDGGNLCRQAQMTSLKSICVSSDNEIMLWHYRLGHPNFQHLKYLFPKLFKNKNPFVLQCDICQIENIIVHHFQCNPISHPNPLLVFIVIFGDHIKLIQFLRKNYF